MFDNTVIKVSLTVLIFWFYLDIVAQDYSNCVIYLNESPDTMSGVVDFSNNALNASFIQFFPNGDSVPVNLPIRDILKIDLYDEAIVFVSVPYGYLDKGGNKIEGGSRLGQIMYSDDKFDLVKLKRLEVEYDYIFIKGMSHVYYVLDKDSGIYYRLDIEEEVYSQYQYDKNEKFKPVLNYLFKDWVGRDKSIERVKYNDLSILNIFVEFASRSGANASDAYIYEVRKDKGFASKSLLEFGIYPIRRFDSFSNSLGIAFSYTYERNKPRSNRYRFDQLGIELISSQSTFFNSSLKYEKINIASVYLGNRFLLTKNNLAKMKISFSLGLSNYLIFSSGQIGRSARVSLSPGMIETVFLSSGAYSEISILPLNVRLGPQVNIGKVSIKVVGDISLFERFEYLFYPVGLKIGCSL